MLLRLVMAATAAWGFIVPGHAEQLPPPAAYTLLFGEDPPFAMTEGERHKGVALGIVGRLFDRAKLPYQFRDMPLARAALTARIQERTCVFPLQRAQDIETEYRWVSPILITRSGLFAAPGSKHKLVTLADARQYSIGALRSSGDSEYLKRFGFNVEEVSSQEQNVQKLQLKRIDFWATDLLSARYFGLQAGGTQSAPREALMYRISLGSLACHVNTPKADLLKLQTVLDQMIKDGSLTRLTHAKF